jgi:hypothetical protein
MGNRIGKSAIASADLDHGAQASVADLNDRFATSRYLTPHSDIVALLVLEHQTGMLNRLARATLETRMALYYQQELNKALGQPLDEPSPSTWSRIRHVGDEVAQYMLFRDEARLTDHIEGTSSFASDFAARGPRDAKGRSLRDLDLRTRLFRYPCSYLIYSRAFDALPKEVKEHIYLRLWEILSGREPEKDDLHLARDDRQAIIEILRDTKTDLPACWKATE